MLTPLTLLDLKNKALALNITGRVMPSNAEMVAYQEMVWEKILSLCTPLNLAIPYNDSGICKIDVYEACRQWYIKAPVIAKVDSEYIDIDSRLKEAFIYYLIAFLSLQGKDNNRKEWELRAERVCVEYACDVDNMGIARAKMVYEQYDGVTGVSFSCTGAKYKIEQSLIDTIISCMLCNKKCIDVSSFKQVERYKEYMAYQRAINKGDDAVFEMLPSRFSGLRALDIGLFFYVMNHMELVEQYGLTAIENVTTLGCELGKLYRNEPVAEWVKKIDIELGSEYRSF